VENYSYIKAFKNQYKMQLWKRCGKLCGKSFPQ